MPHSKTPGGQAASDKFNKQQAEAKGLGAENAPGHTSGGVPGEAPVASDSGATRVGIDNSDTNIPGEKGLNEPPIKRTEPEGNAAQTKA